MFSGTIVQFRNLRGIGREALFPIGHDNCTRLVARPVDSRWLVFGMPDDDIVPVARIIRDADYIPGCRKL